MATTREQTYEQAVAAWADHLRTGGTTTWADFRRAPDVSGAGEGVRPLPDAVHLELVRRINLRGVIGSGVPRLAQLVLSTSAPGRGLVDVPLPWTEPPRFGTPPIEPEQVPAEELIRLAVGVLARLLPAVPPPPLERDPARWPMPWRRRFRLHGSPVTVDAVRRRLLRQGLVESDWRPVHVVVGQPVETMMAEHWAALSAAGGTLRWSTLWRRAEAAGVLPGRIDVVATAERLTARSRRAPHREPVHLVLGSGPHDAARRVADVLGAGAGEADVAVDAGSADLLRRLNRVATVSQGAAHVRRSAATLAGVLAPITEELPGAAPGTPPGSRAWAQASAAAAARRTAGAGYAVHGDPGVLARTEAGLTGTVDHRHTLEVAVEACLRTWRLQEGPP